MNPPTALSARVDGPTLVLEVHGIVSSLADAAALSQLDQALDQLRSGSVTQVLVDLGQSPYFGSMMLETLRRVWNDVHPRAGRMVLCNVSPVGKEILQIAKFDHLWPIVATRADAEAHLQSQA